jgi:acetyltransferase-like isoleucine patch superfamily enzyme
VPNGPITTTWLQIGRGTYTAPDILLKTWLPGERIVIGNYCSIADRVIILTGGARRTDLAALYPFDVTRSYRGTPNTRIDNDVWIGTAAIIIRGAHIGNGAVVAAGAVVTRDVPPFAVAAGNPATIKRHRFPPDIISSLQRIAWWNWPDDQIRRNIDWFYRPIEEFTSHFDPDSPLDPTTTRAP